MSARLHSGRALFSVWRLEVKTLARPEVCAEMQRRLSVLDVGDTARWGSMSVTKMVAHVRDAFRMAMGEVRAAPVKLPVAGEVAKIFALWVPVRWPKGVATVPELHPDRPGLEHGGFSEDRAEVVRLLARFAVWPGGSRHPMFGSMRRADWMRWGYLHTDHHLRQFGR